MFPVLAVLFLVVPVLELAVLIAVGREIGLWWTLLLVAAVSIAGAWLARREGLAAWRRFQSALTQGRMPADEVADGAMILLASALLLTPGFLSDVFGIALLIPPIRAVVRRVAVRAMVERSLRRAGLGGTGIGGTGRRTGGSPWRPSRRPRVIDGEAHGGFDGEPGQTATTVNWGDPKSEPAPGHRREQDQDPPR